MFVEFEKEFERKLEIHGLGTRKLENWSVHLSHQKIQKETSSCVFEDSLMDSKLAICIFSSINTTTIPHKYSSIGHLLISD